MPDRWEYRVVAATKVDEAVLNEHGEAGWELVSAQREGDLDRLIFKRPPGRT